MGQGPCHSRRPPADPEARAASLRAPALSLGSLGTPPKLQRTRSTTAKVFQLRCADRCSAAAAEGSEHRPPVKLIIFDLDETLTLTTFMSEDGTYSEEQYEFTAMLNFESPWVEGSRVEKLQRLLEDLQGGVHGPRRGLAVLTRNNHREGVQAVINLLRVAKLDDYFDAIWTMPWRKALPNGAYQEAGEWKYFNPPIDRIPDHKAHVIEDIAARPKAWFPQLEDEEHLPSEVQELSKISQENIALVDDQQANFQSNSGSRVARYAKVIRYNAQYHDLGLIKDMGGIGAHDDFDFGLLADFVEHPWTYNEVIKCRCLEMPSANMEQQLPVHMVIFDFDETLSLATFMPDDESFRSDASWQPSGKPIGSWKESDLLKYNFESPWVRGKRIQKLRQTLEAIRGSDTEEPRTLAVLAQDPHRSGDAVSILNLLKLAKLDRFFSAIWSFPAHATLPNGVYQDRNGVWNAFSPPVDDLPETKVGILNHVVQHSAEWLPQLAGEKRMVLEGMSSLELENIVLVDNEKLTFTECADSVPRRCQVARFDEIYRDCGLLNQMGGLGAHTDEDYEELLKFVSSPWEFPFKWEARLRADSVCEGVARKKMRRVTEADDLPSRAPRVRGKTVDFSRDENQGSDT